MARCSMEELREQILWVFLFLFFVFCFLLFDMTKRRCDEANIIVLTPMLKK